MSSAALLVIAKQPIPGRVKTRLTPPCTPAEAAALAEAALLDTLATVAQTPASRRVLVFEGDPGPWLPAGFDTFVQRGEGLAERLGAAFDDVDGPALLVGMDTPQVTPNHLTAALAALSRPGVDAVIAPTFDGGYWCVGFNAAVPGAFAGVPMSTERTYVRQRQRFRELGLSVAIELPLRDVDTFADAQLVAREIVGSRFAAAIGRIEPAGIELAAVTSPLELYEQALNDVGTPTPIHVRFVDGSSAPLQVARYLASADRDDRSLLAGVHGPVLDVGCGPGRHLRALATEGVYALGVDLSPVAVAFARRGGGRAVVGDVFGEVPGVGQWATALLLDGNIGIGGRPSRLLSRLRALLRTDGVVLVELEPSDTDTRTALARIEAGEDASDWFPWARVSVTQIGGLAELVGMTVEREWQCGERFFASLRAVSGG